MISHVEINVSELGKSVAFYLSTLGPIGFRMADASDDYARISNGTDAVITLCPVGPAHRDRGYHRRAVGLSHIALAVASREIVDQMSSHLAALGIPLLGDGKVDLGYRRGYYTLAFEDPDRIMIEVVWHDPYYFSLDAP